MSILLSENKIFSKASPSGLHPYISLVKKMTPLNTTGCKGHWESGYLTNENRMKITGSKKLRSVEGSSAQYL